MKEVMVTSNKQSGLLALLDELEKRGVSDAEKTNAMRTYLDAKAREKGIPVHGTFELTPLCNLDCKMCYIHLTEQQVRLTGKKMLNGSQWIAIMEQTIQAGMIDALLTGGEALSHPDFDEIYLYLHSKGIGIAVNTNALLMTKERVDFFRRYRPRSIQITLYGSDDESYERVTGRRCFSKVMDAIECIRDAGLVMHIGITPNRYMSGKGESLIELIESLGVSYSINSSLMTPREETGRSDVAHDLSLDEYVQLYKAQARRRKIKLSPMRPEDIPCPGGGHEEAAKGLCCAAGRSSFCVGWEGFIRPCVSLMEIRADASQEPFASAWQKIQKAVREYPVPRECIGCIYQAVCCPCVVEHAVGSLPGHANPAFCQRARRFANEGLWEILERNEKEGERK